MLQSVSNSLFPSDGVCEVEQTYKHNLYEDHVTKHLKLELSCLQAISVFEVYPFSELPNKVGKDLEKETNERVSQSLQLKCGIWK